MIQTFHLEVSNATAYYSLRVTCWPLVSLCISHYLQQKEASLIREAICTNQWV